MLRERLDRQLRIEGWNQELLEKSPVAVVGDDPLLTSLFIMSSSALGLNALTVIAPSLDEKIIKIAKKINPELALTHIEGYFVHPAMNFVFHNSRAIVNLSTYGLAGKLAINRAYANNIAVIHGYSFAHEDRQGFKVFTYLRGREWLELNEFVRGRQVPLKKSNDPVLSILLSGIVLEELSRYLMNIKPSSEVIRYERKEPVEKSKHARVCIVGAGALGNFVALGLGFAGLKNIAIIDPDVVEVSNLNRQVLFYDSIGASKAGTLSKRLSELFDLETRFQIGYFDRSTEISSFDIIFDCVDNFETRIIISEKCKEERKILISGGSSPDAGQVVIYHPGLTNDTPAETLKLYDIVDRRQVDKYERSRESCVYRPEPSVITTNQIIAGFMVDLSRSLLSQHEVENIFYDSKSPRKF